MVTRLYPWIGILLVVYFPSDSESGSINNEKKIREMLFENQQAITTHTRPVKLKNNTINIQIQMYLKHIIELDQINETLSAQLILRLEWYDTRLTWNPAQFGDVKEIHITRDLIWIPDLTFYNEIDQQGDVFDDTLLMVHSSGKIVWTAVASTLTTCSVNLQHYPFDEHRCGIRLGSWTYHGYHVAPELKSNIALHPNEIDENMSKTSRAAFQEHNLWEVTHATVVIEKKKYSCCEEPYPSAVMYITLARKTPQFVMTLLLPTFVSILMMLMIFCFPPASKEKLDIGCFVFLYLLLLDISAYWTIPRNGSSIPNIVSLIGSAVILAGMSLLVSILTLSLSRSRHRGGIPLFLKNILSSFLKNILCLNFQSQGISDAATSMVETDPWRHDKIEKRHEWLILAKAIDRLFLILMFIVTIILLGTFLRISKVPVHPLVPYNSTA